MPIAPVVIEFTVGGAGRVAEVIGTLEKRMDRAAKTGVKGQQAAANDQVRIAQRLAKDKERLVAASLKNEQRIRDTAAKQEFKAHERALKEQNVIRNKINQLSVHDEQKRLRDVERLQVRALQTQERNHRTFGASAGGILGRGVGRVVGMAGKVAAVAGAIGGGFTIADVLSKGIRQEERSGIIFRGAQDKGKFKNQAELTDLARNAAINSGGTTDDIQGGLDKYVRKTGDLGSANDMLTDMAKTAAATGVEFSDMGDTTAEVFNTLKDTEKTMQVIRALAGQGKAGAIDFKDLGLYGARLTSNAQMFGGDLAGNIESFGAIAQIAKKQGGAIDAAAATESVAMLPASFIKHQDKFRSRGVEVFTDKTHKTLRPAEDLIKETVVKSKGNLGFLRGEFDERAMHSILGAQVEYKKAGGGKAGADAISKLFADSHTTMSKDDVDKDAASRMAETGSKLNVALEQAQRAFGDRLLPLLPGLIQQFTDMVPALANMLGWLLSNPMEGVGLALAGSIGLEVAKSGVAIMLKDTLAMAAGGASTAMGTLGAAAGIASAAMIAFAVGKAGTDKVFSLRDSIEKGRVAATVTAGNADSVTDALKAGRITPEQAQAQMENIKKTVAQQKSSAEDANSFTGATGIDTSAPGEFEGRGFMKGAAEVQTALDTLATAIKASAGTIASNPVNTQPTLPTGTRPNK